MRTFLRLTFVTGALSALALLAPEARAQSYVVPGGSTSGWGGYGPQNPWAGYAPSTAWGGYAPGTAWGGYAPVVVAPPTTVAPPTATAPATTTLPGVGTPIYGQYANQTFVDPYGRVVTGSTFVPRQLQNSTRFPVRGPTPYADGRPRQYYEYGSGRNVPLAKPWLPGSPGGR